MKKCIAFALQNRKTEEKRMKTEHNERENIFISYDWDKLKEVLTEIEKELEPKLKEIELYLNAELKKLDELMPELQDINIQDLITELDRLTVEKL